MEIKTGYLYHIKDEFFDNINDNGIMINHENGHSRPTYFTIKDKDILWFIPISSKVDKYKKILGTMPSGENYTLLMSIMTDELIHANKYNYLINKLNIVN